MVLLQIIQIELTKNLLRKMINSSSQYEDVLDTF